MNKGVSNNRKHKKRDANKGSSAVSRNETKQN